MSKWIAGLVVMAGVLAPGDALAQVCAGTPVADGQRMFGGRVILFDGGTQFGGMGTFNVDGPLSIEVNADLVDFDDFDDMGFEIAGRGFYELANLEIPLCPMAGLSFFTVDELNVLTVSIGSGIGARVELSPNADMIFHGIPQLLLSRASIDDESETDSDFLLELGGTIAGERIFGSLLIYLGDDEAFGVRIGFVQ